MTAFRTCGVRAARRGGEVFTVPLRLVTGGAVAYQMLCRECFQSVLGVEPGEELLMRPIRHARRSRR